MIYVQIELKPTSMKQDVDCFADAVEDLINNPEKRVAYGVHARERILNVYNGIQKGDSWINYLMI